jgi:single-stranded-DNA-specific exonuclease
MFKDSIINAKWELLNGNLNKAMTYNQKLGLHSAVSEILSLNQDLTIEEVEDFISPSLRKLLPNPFLALMEVSLAVERIIKAIKGKEKIVIFGDYDVDGATSSAIFKRFFQSIGVKSEIYIPDRIKEGYGPSSNALLKLREGGTDLVITVDCGTVAFEPLQKAKEAGLEIIVIDHHLGVKTKPESIAVINPNRWDETSELTYLCGAGVSFMLIVALNMKLKEEKYYAKNNISEPNLLSLVDLVALGTVCDVMPLIGLNRAFVKTGIEVIKAKTNLGIQTLLGIAGAETEITEYTLGFIVGPRINAGGRIGKSDLGANLLSTKNESEALEIAKILHELNSKRKDIETESLEVAISKIERTGGFEKDIIFVEDDTFHQGIIGILAGRIKERYNKPVAVFSRLDGYLKASLRSIAGIDIGALIHKANEKGLIMAGGGHEMAGGLSVLSGEYANLEQFFLENLLAVSGGIDMQKKIFISSIITPLGLNLQLAEQLKMLRPFGNGNPKPIFAMQDLAVIKLDILKERHISMILKDEISGKTVKAMFFKAYEMGVLSFLEKLYGKKVDVVGELEINEWNGSKTIQINLIDVAV